MAAFKKIPLNAPISNGFHARDASKADETGGGKKFGLQRCGLNQHRIHVHRRFSFVPVRFVPRVRGPEQKKARTKTVAKVRAAIDATNRKRSHEWPEAFMPDMKRSDLHCRQISHPTLQYQAPALTSTTANSSAACVRSHAMNKHLNENYSFRGMYMSMYRQYRSFPVQVRIIQSLDLFTSMDNFKSNNQKSSDGDRYCLKVDNAGSADSSSRSPSPNRSIRGLNLFRMISHKIGKSVKKSKEIISSDDDEDSNSSSNSLTKKDNSDLNECDCDYLYKLERNIVMISAKNQSNSFAKEAEKRGGKGKMGQEYRSRNERCLRFSTPYNGYHSSGSDPYSSNDDSFNSNDSDQATGANHFSSNDSSTSSSSGSYRNSRAIVRKVLKSLNLNSRSLSCSSITQMKEMSLNDRREIGSKEKRTKKSPQKILRQPVSYTYVRGISGLPTHRVVNTRGCYNNQYSRG